LAVNLIFDLKLCNLLFRVFKLPNSKIKKPLSLWEKEAFNSADYLLAGVVEAAGVTVFTFLWLLCFFTTFATGVTDAVVGVWAKTKPVVEPRNSTVIKAAINFFI
jgi:hypothetical protein